MSLELEQVRVALTKNPELMATLKSRKQLRKDNAGREYFSIVFNSSEIKFYPNQPLVLGKTIAECLVRSSYVIVGESDLTGEMIPVLEALDGYNLNKFIEERPVCEYCRQDFPTARALSHHLLAKHRDALDKADETLGVEVIETAASVPATKV